MSANIAQTTAHTNTGDAGPQDAPALNTLVRAGAHFVLCRDKRPIWTGWNKRGVGLQTAIHHLSDGGEIGIVPASLHETVLDIDQGNPADLHRAIGPPRASLDGRSRQDAHAWYDDDTPRGNGKFDVAGCQGDIRSGAGYTIIHYRQFDKLINGLFRTGRFQIQADIFDLPGVQPGKGRETPQDAAGIEGVELAGCPVGYRNQSLFDALRVRVYPLPRDDDPDDWNRRVLEMAVRLNERIPEPLPFPEVRKTAYSVSTWTYNRGFHVEMDHGFEAQHRRGVKRHYGDATPGRLWAIRERNGLICDLHGIGWTQAEIAAHDGVNVKRAAVGRILRKAGGYGLDIAARETITEAAPWEAEGISRRTWYRRKMAQNATA